MLEMVDSQSVAIGSEDEKVLLKVLERSTECRGFEMGAATMEVQ